ncbi:hypothetical protein BC937DRAFT_92886 [Endogone sp. FLAS-F59071]|nr:hypothetical protein BC937DRAFT_92886 [Endogone sp. FLAS-F59071]|eukprot:RUS15109.1 hypothetical protein BC937DRAFT_92886 [Endogone sp. FLAS-F59071]
MIVTTFTVVQRTLFPMALQVESPKLPSTMPIYSNDADLAESFDAAAASAIPLLSEGLSAHFMPMLENVNKQLQELEKNQRKLIDQIAEASESVERDYDLSAISSTQRSAPQPSNLAKIPQYHAKLQNIRTTMFSLSSRSKQLQRRAAQLKATRLAYEAQADEIRRREQARDQVIAARVVAGLRPVETTTPPALVSPPVSEVEQVAVVNVIVKKKAKPDSGTKKKKRREVEIEEAPIGVNSTKGPVTMEESAGPSKGKD